MNWRLAVLVDEALEHEGYDPYKMMPGDFTAIVETLTIDLKNGVPYADPNARVLVRGWAADRNVTQEER